MSQLPSAISSAPQERKPLVDIGTLAARLKAELDDAMQARKMVEDRCRRTPVIWRFRPPCWSA